MRTLALLVALLALPVFARAQEPEAPDGAVIGSVQVNGIGLDRLSPGLQRDIDAIKGRALSREYVDELAARIESERPDVVAAVRTAIAPDGEARVLIFVARIDDDLGLSANINARYIVESVSIDGVPETRVSDALRADMQLLVGTRLDYEAAQKLARRLRDELPGYDVTRRMSRGTKHGQIAMVFDIRKGEGLRWIHFAPSRTKYLYHSDQGWGGFQDIPIGGRDLRVTLAFAIDNADDLIEEYTGYEVRVETRNVGTERLGIGLDLLRFHQEWTDATLAAIAVDADTPEAYRVRAAVAPFATFAFTPHLHATGGVSISELESLSNSPASQTANAFVTSVGYDQDWKRRTNPRTWDPDQRVEAGFSLHAGADALESDLVYKRYFGSGSYRLSWGKNDVLASVMGGHISGQAPLFERFSLGDSSTLRGWNKYDIAPAGGDDMFHSSFEYRNHGLALFLDSGSVWDRHTERQTRVSTGFGFHTDNVFVTLGFPLNTDDVRAVFMMGVRF